MHQFRCDSVRKQFLQCQICAFMVACLTFISGRMRAISMCRKTFASNWAFLTQLFDYRLALKTLMTSSRIWNKRWQKHSNSLNARKNFQLNRFELCLCHRKHSPIEPIIDKRFFPLPTLTHFEAVISSLNQTRLKR